MCLLQEIFTDNFYFTFTNKTPMHVSCNILLLYKWKFYKFKNDNSENKLKVKIKSFMHIYPGAPSGEPTTTVCGDNNYQLKIAVPELK